MRAVVQRVSEARVEVEGRIVGSIGTGLLVLVAAANDDSAEDARYLADRVRKLRIFEDGHGKMNRSLEDTGGSVLAVSNFTVLADTRKGHRPSFDPAAPAAEAKGLYEHFVARCRESGIHTETGVFQADMQVYLVNSGPVTLILDSKKNLRISL